MKKLLLLFLFSILLIGCTNNNKDEEINTFVVNNDYAVVIEKIDENVSNIVMFPTEELEEEFIYYIKAIVNNLSKYTKEEVRSIYNKVNINYSFKFNNINYSVNDFRDDLRKIENYMNS